MRRIIRPATIELLENRLRQYATAGFIRHDPIQIPHLFSQKQDIEIAGLFAAVLAWGQRTTIIRNARNLMQRMDMKPFHFVVNHSPKELKVLEGFVHRTFNDTDLLYFVHFLRHIYQFYPSLEDAFATWLNPDDRDIEPALTGFQRMFTSLPEMPGRTAKHISSPERNSACKRLCMYLRWMVRKDSAGVDFGIWEKIKPRQLICPLDVHVHRVALGLRLISHHKADWQAACELTAALRKLDPADPVKYDYALFGLGAEERY